MTSVASPAQNATARQRRAGTPPRPPSVDAELAAASYEATTFFWSFLAGIGVLTWVVLYLV